MARSRVIQAVDDIGWQRFRLSLKGLSTEEKITKLEDYYDEQVTQIGLELAFGKPSDGALADKKVEDVKIRIDNYIKALCRGGQLEAGMTFDHFNDGCLRNHIKK